jgi:hypothetical protein
MPLYYNAGAHFGSKKNEGKKLLTKIKNSRGKPREFFYENFSRSAFLQE